MYHDIYSHEPSESGFQSKGSNHYKIDRTTFEAQVKLVHDLNLSEQVVFTFDDGGASLYYNAAPILEKYGMRGIVCVPTKYIGKDGFLTVSQIKELYRRGHTIASHSHSHPSKLSALNNIEHSVEWKKSIKILSEIIETKIDIFSIPNGYYSNRDKIEAPLNSVHFILISLPEVNKIINNVFIKGRVAITERTNNKKFLRIIKQKSYRSKLKYRQYLLDKIKDFIGLSLYMSIKKIFRGYIYT